MPGVVGLGSEPGVVTLGSEPGVMSQGIVSLGSDLWVRSLTNSDTLLQTQLM